MARPSCCNVLQLSHALQLASSAPSDRIGLGSQSNGNAHDPR